MTTRGPVATDELTRVVERLASIGFCAVPSFSPDGRRISFVSDLSGTPQVWTVPVVGGFPERVTDFPDQVTTQWWSPTDDWIAVEVAPGGGLNLQVYLVRPNGTELRRLTPGGRENNRLVRWSPDGRVLYISSSREDPSHFDTFAVDVATGEWRRVARTRGVSGLTHISSDGRWAVLSRTIARGDSNLYLLDLERGGERLVTPHDGQAMFFAARFGADGSIWLASDDRRERLGLARIALKEGESEPMEYVRTREDADLDGISIEDAGARAVLTWSAAGRSELELIDLATRRAERVAVPHEIVADVWWMRGGPRFAAVLTGAAAPVDIWVFEPGTAPRQLTRSPHPGIDLASLVRPRRETFAAHDGIELTGWLFVPRDFHAPGPTVLSFHGGPEGQERPFLNHTYQALLANGIAVFAPNVRGSAGFGRTFVHLDDREKRVDAVRDIRSCVDHLIRIGVADPKRIGITGASYGGYMTMAGITEFPDAFAGAVCVCGIINFLTFFQHTQPWMAAISKSEYGDPETQRDLLEKLSPINKIDRAKTPLLVLHGANDTNVPLIEAEQMVDELRRSGVEVKAVIFPDEGHGFTKTANRTRAAVETVRWFATHL